VRSDAPFNRHERPGEDREGGDEEGDARVAEAPVVPLVEHDEQ
jgi:hypothetical protein